MVVFSFCLRKAEKKELKIYAKITLEGYRRFQLYAIVIPSGIKVIINP